MRLILLLTCFSFLYAEESTLTPFIPSSPDLFALSSPKPVLPLEPFFRTPALLLVDRYYSPEVGSEGFIPVLRGLQRIESRLLPIVDVPSTTWPARLGRFAEQFFFWGPLNSTVMTAQHEIFGHGFRVRALGASIASVDRYNIGIPFPYGMGGGYTAFYYDPESLSPQDKIAITAGGVEGTAILAKRLKFKWLQEGSVPPKESMLYYRSEQDLTDYAWTSVLLEKNGTLHGDIYEYVTEVNATYGSNLTVQSVALASLWNYADPFSVYSIWSWWKYVLDGTTLSLSMIPIGEYRYLPGARLGLSPFGPEYYSEHFLIRGEKPLYIYLKGGDRSYGIGFERPLLWQWKIIRFGLCGDLWLQPVMNGFGGAASASATTDFFERGAFYLQLGGKTEGYLPGESLAPALIARFGLSLET